MARFPAAQENAAVNAVTANMPYEGLNTGDPGTTGANEVSGGSYARQSVTWGSASAGTAVTTNAQNFTSMPSCTCTYMSWWSASSAGTYEGGGALGSSLTVPSGATVAVAIGAASVAMS